MRWLLALALVACTRSGASCHDHPVCPAYVCTGSGISTSWVMDQAATGTCSTSPPTDQVLYASCDTIPNSPSDCGLESGMQMCEGVVWTSLCQTDDDCPSGTRCFAEGHVGDIRGFILPPYGTCEKTCSHEGNPDCGRCDRACDTTIGVCSLVVPNNPTNQRCDATHPAIAVTLTFVGPGGYFSFGGRLELQLPSSGPFDLDVQETQVMPDNTARVVVAYPAGTTAGPATAIFSGCGPGSLDWYGTTSFAADPTQCTPVAVTVNSSGFPADAGP